MSIDERVAALERDVARLTNVVAAMAGANSLSPGQVDILRYLLDRKRNGPVKSMFFAGLLRITDRTVRRYLSELEALGYVHRPGGEKSGWAATGIKLPFDE